MRIMKEINIGKILSEKRRQKGITQDELAEFIGVSKAAVSKWETETSYPDIVLLPQLAAYFNCSVDELLNYQPQMIKDDIRKLYHRLAMDFAKKLFEDVASECEDIIKKYFSCYPLLVQMAGLFVNHSFLSPEPQKILLRAVELCSKIRKECQDVWTIKEALMLESQIYLMLQEPQKAIELIGETVHPIMQETNGLAMAYQMLGNNEEANRILQISMYQHLCMLLIGAIPYIVGKGEDPERIRQTIERMLKIVEVFEVDKLHENTAFNVYMAAAQFYASIEEKENAYSMLERYVNCCRDIQFPLILKGDAYFDKIDGWLEEFELGKDSPVNSALIKSALLQGLKNNPNLAIFVEEPKFQKLVKQLETILEGK